MATTTDWQFGRADAARSLAADILFDYPVFQRMEADNYQPAAPGWSKAEQAPGLRKYRVKAVEFTIDTDPERKKNLGGGVKFLAASYAPQGLLRHFG